MKKTILLLYLMTLAPITAQNEKFQGQPPIEIVPTTSKPVQKQWKGSFTYDSANITFSNNFEGARLNGIIKNNDSTYTALITSENTPINTSPWYAFKIWAKEKRTINVILTYQASAKHRYYPKLSFDGLRWSPLDSIQYTEFEKGDKNFGPGSLPVKISMKLEVGRDTLWIAGQELHTSSHVGRWMDSLSQKPFVSRKSMGKSREGRLLDLLTIGNPKSKNMLMVISRQHPPEVTGYLAMKSFIETMASDAKLARRFRKKFTTYVVPLMNPDGVDNGHWRHNAGGVDLNRDWANFNHPETRAVKKFMEEKVVRTNGKFYFGIDFHSTWDDIYYTVDPKLKGNMPDLVPTWLDAIKEEVDGYDPNVRPSDRMHPTTVSRNYFFVEHGAEALVFEIGDNTPREFLREKGRISANVLMELMLERLK
ncbi:M14 family metallopeptidase [Flagellimonas pacifica]|uniref:Zinc carboxypeptidase n=1 Tax=Flagellimonas pacifica TaxID=1247520 RepID=A0A285MVX4_9FLAO|nr:M14 family metallopeptidase [Allomuricauda parva]SNZ01352.1 Zinc carboxypeptidase [Allomuricauda parva]